MIIRDLHTIDDFRRVVELEHAIWGYTDPADTVTVPVFIITMHRGGMLLGAFDEAERMVGFAFSIVGMKDGQPLQWSHMTGVLPEYRGGLGYRLKLAQRERALALGYSLIEWTFDPLQAMNAHLNCSKLGAVAEAYAEDFYGASTSALHRGTPTDRLIASWHIREPHVVRRLEGGPLQARAADVADAPIANPAAVSGQWRTPTTVDLSIDSRRLWIEIPTGFTDIQQNSHDLALEWRMLVRKMFLAYFGRGYRVVDFALSREQGYGRYLLARSETAAEQA